MKSAFTRACNDKTRDVKSGLMLPEFKKGRAKKKEEAGEDDEELDEDEEDGAAEEEEEEDEQDVDRKKMNALAKRGLNISLKDGGEFAGAAKGKKAAAKPAGKGKGKAK